MFPTSELATLSKSGISSDKLSVSFSTSILSLSSLTDIIKSKMIYIHPFFEVYSTHIYGKYPETVNSLQLINTLTNACYSSHAYTSSFTLGWKCPNHPILDPMHLWGGNHNKGGSQLQNLRVDLSSNLKLQNE